MNVAKGFSETRVFPFPVSTRGPPAHGTLRGIEPIKELHIGRLICSFVLCTPDVFQDFPHQSERTVPCSEPEPSAETIQPCETLAAGAHALLCIQRKPQKPLIWGSTFCSTALPPTRQHKHVPPSPTVSPRSAQPGETAVWSCHWMDGWMFMCVC